VDPLSGLSGGVVFVNSSSPPPIEGTVIYHDVTGEAIKVLGRGGAISSGIGAVASKILGFSLSKLEEAVSNELSYIGLSPELIEKNIIIAKNCYSAVDFSIKISKIHRRDIDIEGRTPKIVKLNLDPTVLSIATILSLGNTQLKNTGSWRIMKPVISVEKCIKCDLCYVYCPEGCIELDEQRIPQIIYDYCKGCLICSTICPVKAISTVREVRTW
jgi:2-oxoacid:acceptor oxidoreductase delta subunit (pyruvate/2-ketoisovalerate family)